ncbi:inosine-5'-monophosphate dehydrogenase [Halarchaeum acidiphilum MH1-52-1]|uniref:Inosine-5'-monophosphate dehydrogenase n=1 Tax=Halarchaeum acidiphilum MH1-52-1 TaxID=1261545 RepID=U3ADJ8_9EURY|nr:CBS domain-containing protein [Halarchaeum acidiphilum]GAD52833.1 inosine-5'-monophosphate dehydrogenase [Halarchaeum acidiphilum MH1-52-1]
MALTARDLMTTDVETVAPDDEIGDVLTKLSRRDFTGFPVVDGSDLVGVVTEHDLVDIFQPSDRTLYVPFGLPPFLESLTYALDLSWDELDVELDLAKNAGRPISGVMSTDVTTVRPDASLDDVLAVLADGEEDVNRIPVVEDGHLVGIVARQDVLGAVYRERTADADEPDA